eukprot:TRINITY_DN3891_c0_g1_i1.p1 TRINITY_DN3891_c0_g1~~TRINITY_DN3891_c0_g1_i1.p1  ORF type:complete len:246 (+),score=35.41 TRINITY_DN3891_c0_g1_i1:395-1132(+)
MTSSSLTTFVVHNQHPASEPPPRARTVRYSDSDASVSFSQQEQCKGAQMGINHMLRTLVVLTQSMAALPEERTISMRLVYESCTPAEYEPPFFCAAPESVRKQVQSGQGIIQVKVGGMDTKYHSMDLRCRAPREWMYRVHNDPSEEEDAETQGSKEEESPKIEQSERNASNTPDPDAESSDLDDVKHEESPVVTESVGSLKRVREEMENDSAESIECLLRDGKISFIEEPVLQPKRNRMPSWQTN